MEIFEGLKFKRGTTSIHRLDPRAKFILSCSLFALTLLFTELPVLILLFSVQLILIRSAKIFREWSRTLRNSLPLIGLIFFTNLIVGWFGNDYQITSQLLIYSTRMAFRFATLMSSFSLFFLTTSPDDLSLALEQSRVPYEFCFAFTTAIRFVPVLAAEAQTIMDAQKSRGLELEKGNFLQRIRNYVPILIPLIVGAIRRSLELAEAMETRGFGAKKLRTNLYHLKLNRGDYLVFTLSLTFVVLALYARYNIPIPTFLVDG